VQAEKRRDRTVHDETGPLGKLGHDSAVTKNAVRRFLVDPDTPAADGIAASQLFDIGQQLAFTGTGRAHHCQTLPALIVSSANASGVASLQVPASIVRLSTGGRDGCGDRAVRLSVKV